MQGEDVVRAFKAQCPDYLATNSNYERMVETLAFNALRPSEQHLDYDDQVNLLVERGYWTVDNLQRVYEALNREDLLDRPAGEPRNLSERERLRVVRLAQAGRLDQAIGKFLRCSLDGEEPDWEIAHDPRYRELCDQAVYIVFVESTLDFVETPERKAFLLRYAGSRPLTLPILRQAWQAYQATEQRRDRSAMVDRLRPREQKITERELDNLPDQQVDDLYRQALRERAVSPLKKKENIIMSLDPRNLASDPDPMQQSPTQVDRQL